jgi:hypothetical protein
MAREKRGVLCVKNLGKTNKRRKLFHQTGNSAQS